MELKEQFKFLSPVAQVGDFLKPSLNPRLDGNEKLLSWISKPPNPVERRSMASDFNNYKRELLKSKQVPPITKHQAVQKKSYFMSLFNTAPDLHNDLSGTEILKAKPIDDFRDDSGKLAGQANKGWFGG